MTPCYIHAQLSVVSVQLKAFALSPSGERLENPTTIEIVVLDQNDNRPVFTQSQFVGTVSEFSVPGTRSCFIFYTQYFDINNKSLISTCAYEDDFNS